MSAARVFTALICSSKFSFSALNLCFSSRSSFFSTYMHTELRDQEISMFQFANVSDVSNLFVHEGLYRSDKASVD